MADPLGITMGRVSFGGITKEICLAYTPEISVGDYVIVHVGFAISRVDEREARRVFDVLAQMGELDELDWSPGDDEIDESGAPREPRTP